MKPKNIIFFQIKSNFYSTDMDAVAKTKKKMQRTNTDLIRDLNDSDFKGI